MIDAEFSQIKQRIEGAYRVTLTTTQADAYWDLWGRFPVEAIIQALTWYMRDDASGRAPTAPQIVRLADQAWRDALAKRQQLERRTLKEAALLVFHGDPSDERLSRDGGIGAFACQLIRDLCDDKITHAEFTTRQEEMARRWPPVAKACPCDGGLVWSAPPAPHRARLLGRCGCAVGDRQMSHLRRVDPRSGAQIREGG